MKLLPYIKHLQYKKNLRTGDYMFIQEGQDFIYTPYIFISKSLVEDLESVRKVIQKNNELAKRALYPDEGIVKKAINDILKYNKIQQEDGVVYKLYDLPLDIRSRELFGRYNSIYGYISIGDGIIMAKISK